MCLCYSYILMVALVCSLLVTSSWLLLGDCIIFLLTVLLNFHQLSDLYSMIICFFIHVFVASLQQALVGEGSGEEKLFSAVSSITKDGSVDDLGSYIKKLKVFCCPSSSPSPSPCPALLAEVCVSLVDKKWHLLCYLTICCYFVFTWYLLNWKSLAEKSPEILMCRTPKELYDNCGICGYSTPWNSEEILWYLYDFF